MGQKYNLSVAPYLFTTLGFLQFYKMIWEHISTITLGTPFFSLEDSTFFSLFNYVEGSH